MGGAFGKKKDRRKQKRARNYLWASSGLEFHAPLSFGGIVFFVFPSYPFIPIFFFCLKKKKMVLELLDNFVEPETSFPLS